jgi:ketosteroid isomerase-like protein
MRGRRRALSVAGMEHIGTVQEIYEAFGRGDIPAILDRLAEDVVFEPWDDHSAQAAGVPWLARREGRDGVLGFFEALGALEFNALEPQGFLAGDGQVAVPILLDVTVKATGRRLRDEELHLWSFDDAGRVSWMRHYVDTAKHIAAA